MDKLSLGLTKELRQAMWKKITETIESYFDQLESFPIVPVMDHAKIRDFIKSIDFNQPIDPLKAVAWATEGLTKYQMHMPHPRYFGHFCPPSSSMGIAADALAATFNPQLATWRASPFAVEVEQHLIQNFGKLFGYEKSYGHFTSGGTEANHTALLCALIQRFPEFRKEGIVGLKSRPTVYVSEEAHHCHTRAAALSGLGVDYVRHIKSNSAFQMDVDELSSQIAKDRQDGLTPLMVVGTLGTTNAGAIDPIEKIAEIANREGIWFHLDAAYGGAAILASELKDIFKGTEKADSFILDAHKWFSVPMAAGIFMTRHPKLLENMFKFSAAFIDLERTGRIEGEEVDLHYQSMQWSRRFIGLKLFLTLAVAGWEGYRELIRSQIQLGELLRKELKSTGWEILNQTPLPIVCFVDTKHPEGRETSYLEKVAKKVVKSNQAWIFCSHLNEATPALRACVISYWSSESDIHRLVKGLNQAREDLTY